MRGIHLEEKGQIKKIIAKSGVPAGKSIYIGDEIRDIEAARGLNMTFGGVSWGYNRVESLESHSPELLFESIHEIPEKIV